MVMDNNYGLSDDQQLQCFEKQTVFKRPEAEGNSGISIGLPQNMAGSLSYLLGFVSGFAMLLIERDNYFVRFHAIQSICVSISFFTVYWVLGMLPAIGGMSEDILSPVGLALWILLMLNAFNGKSLKLLRIGLFAEKQLK